MPATSAGPSSTVPVRTAVAARTVEHAPPPAVVGRAVHPSEAVTEVIVPERAVAPAAPEAAAPSLRVDVSGDGSPAAPAAPEPAADPLEDSGVGTWVPVPVPPPAYTLKPTARRPEPAPLPEPEPAAAVVERAEPAGAEPRPTTGGLALDAILARRRAAGE